MSIRSSIALTLVVALTAGSMPVLVRAAPQAQQPNGTIAGIATDEAKKPYADYKVQLRDLATSQIVSTVTLDPQGRFTFGELALTKKYLVELYNTPKNKIVCTEGPYDLTRTFLKNDVDISCNKVPAAWWLLGVAAAAGITAGVVVANQSNSQ